MTPCLLFLCLLPLSLFFYLQRLLVTSPNLPGNLFYMSFFSLLLLSSSFLHQFLFQLFSIPSIFYCPISHSFYIYLLLFLLLILSLILPLFSLSSSLSLFFILISFPHNAFMFHIILLTFISHLHSFSPSTVFIQFTFPFDSFPLFLSPSILSYPSLFFLNTYSYFLSPLL